MADIIQLHDVSYRYAGGDEVLRQLTLSLKQGEMAFVTGASGAGKSTLLRLIAALLRPQRGRAVVMGQNLASLKPRRVPAFRQQLGLIFQNFQLLYDRTVFDNVALPLVIKGYGYADIAKRVRAALDSVGLLGKEKSYPIRLAGGEQQRVGIARAIVTRPAILLADEPTGNLDPQMAREVMQIFARFNEVGVSVLVATHAVELIRQFGRRIVRLEGGRLAEAAHG